MIRFHTQKEEKMMDNLNRRSALAKLGKGIAASTTLATVAVAAQPSDISPELLLLIDAHRAARKAYEAVWKWADAEPHERYQRSIDERGLRSKLGHLLDGATKAQLAEITISSGLGAATDAASDAGVAVDEAASAICTYRCKSLAEVRRWGALLAEVIEDDGHKDCPELFLTIEDWRKITNALASASEKV
jgi:hypothetical protein